MSCGTVTLIALLKLIYKFSLKVKRITRIRYAHVTRILEIIHFDSTSRDGLPMCHTHKKCPNVYKSQCFKTTYEISLTVPDFTQLFAKVGVVIPAVAIPLASNLLALGLYFPNFFLASICLVAFMSKFECLFIGDN